MPKSTKERLVSGSDASTGSNVRTRPCSPATTLVPGRRAASTEANPTQIGSQDTNATLNDRIKEGVSQAIDTYCAFQKAGGISVDERAMSLHKQAFTQAISHVEDWKQKLGFSHDPTRDRIWARGPSNGKRGDDKMSVYVSAVPSEAVCL